MALPGVYKSFNERWAGQTVWVISDTHFGDKELRAGVPGRPSDEQLVKNINSLVGRKDTLLLLGDVGDVEYVKQLRGYKVLIAGNHDAGISNYEKKIIYEEFDKDKYSKEEVLATMEKKYPRCFYNLAETHDFHAPFERFIAWADNKLFNEVYEGALIIGEKLILSHEPVDIPWLFNIHGHDHKGAKRANHLNVCADVVGYFPVNLNQFLKTGPTSKVETIHRLTIDKATARKAKRGGKKIGF